MEQTAIYHADSGNEFQVGISTAFVGGCTGICCGEFPTQQGATMDKLTMLTGSNCNFNGESSGWRVSPFLQL